MLLLTALIFKNFRQLIPIIVIMMAPYSFAEEAYRTISSDCETQVVTQEIEVSYSKIQSQLEDSFNNGLPKKLKDQLMTVRTDIDSLSLRIFDMDMENGQQINMVAQQTLQNLERMISLLPQLSQMAPQVRTNFVVPFTNYNSLRAEHQECLMKLAVEDAQQETAAEESSSSIYQKLTTELKKLNENLYALETTDVQRFIGLRARLLKDLSQYNTKQQDSQLVAQQIPQVLNSVQAEIEKVLPGLQLSQNYNSIAK